MLRTISLGAVILASLWSGHAIADDAPRAIHQPVRLTAGPSSDLMGVLSRDENALYFVSDASATLDLMVQWPLQSGPRPVSSGLGDVAWPQVSPDGKHIAYISFERDSTGDVCVRSLSGDGKSGSEKCLTGADSAELQVLWWDKGALAVLSRRDLHGDYVLRKIPIRGGKTRAILSRNMVGLSLSPDRRWLAYIPVEKRASGVGVTFSNRTAVGIRLQRIGGGGGAGKKAAPVLFEPKLPGVTGYLAFSEDGKHLYFSQYLNDTNRDGSIDGNDNGVIFRLRFDSAKKVPVAKQEPTQLTSARWDCHYPAPTSKRLITSCSHDGSLDVYSLPLGGAVPKEWNAARIKGEIAVARDLWTQLLLSARLLELVPAAQQARVLHEIMALHLELGEYESAIYYAEKRAAPSKSLTWANVIGDLARHRRADLALIRGQLSQQYIKSERDRAVSLRTRGATADPAVRDFAAMVVSEIEDDIGDKAAAAKTFAAVKLTGLSEPLLAKFAAARARTIYRLRGERETLLRTYKHLSELDVVGTAQRLRHAHEFVAELGRGLPLAKRGATITKWRAEAADDSELALLLDAEAILLELDNTTQEQVRKKIFKLYKKNKDLHRRRALVLSSLQAAAKVGNEYMQYQFATSWASWLKRTHPERKYAEAIYRNIVLDRAYGEGAQGEIAESRGYFYGATISTESLEGHIGFIEARIAEGTKTKVGDLDEVYRKRFEKDPESPVYAFVKAYRIARGLPDIRKLRDHDRDVDEVIAYLKEVLVAKPKEAQVHQLWGYALHQRARRSGSREAAVGANRQYLLALDLAAADQRLKAALLHRLGLLQASLGNHRLALRYLLRRERLPHVRPLAELGLRVAIARSAWHADEPLVAKAQMLVAAELLEKRPSLRKYKPLVLDRLALSLAAAGDASSARIRYNELAALSEKDSDATPINRVKTHIGLAVSAIESGKANDALKALAKADQLLTKGGTFEDEPVIWREPLVDDYRYTRLQYRALVSGLLQRAYRAKGDEKGARRAIKKRIELFEARLKRSKGDEDRFALAQAYHQLGEIHYRLKEIGEARAAIERGLELSTIYNKNTGSGVNDAGLALVQAYAELHIYGKAPLGDLKIDLRAELARAYSFVCKYRSPRWARQRFLFEIYLTMLSLDSPA